MPGHGASDQLKEEGGARQRYSAVIVLWQRMLGRGGGIPPKGFLPTAWRKALNEVSRTSWEEQGVMKVD